jgi:hypothetical protein
MYHKTVSTIVWQIMDIIHEQSNDASGAPTPCELLAKLVPYYYDEMEENLESFQ